MTELIQPPIVQRLIDRNNQIDIDDFSEKSLR